MPGCYHALTSHDARAMGGEVDVMWCTHNDTECEVDSCLAEDKGEESEGQRS